MPADEVTIRALGHPGDLGWVVMAHGEVYAREFGWDTRFETLVARIVADYAEAADAQSADAEAADAQSADAEAADARSAGARAAWIAERAGERVGCVFVVPGDEPEVAKLRILLVTGSARGVRLGARLVTTAIEYARATGYTRMQLWTNDPLAAARRIYLDLGFVLTGEEPHHSFGVDLIGQFYELDLRRMSD